MFYPPATFPSQLLRKRGIIVRFFGSQGGDLNNYIRISAGKPEQITKVLEALQAIAAEAGLE